MGSDGVLKSYSDLHRHSADPNQSKDTVKATLLFEALLYELRKDLGHGNRRLKERDILALFIGNVDADGSGLPVGEQR